MVMILETEIWPSLYAESKRFGACLILVNARISSKSWPQYAAMKWFFAPVLRLADAVFPQSVADRDRYYQLGVAPARLHTAGNLKYDASSMVPKTVLPAFEASQIWIAASTSVRAIRVITNTTLMRTILFWMQDFKNYRRNLRNSC